MWMTKRSKGNGVPVDPNRKNRSPHKPRSSPQVSVVTCFLVRGDGRILALRRSSRVGTYQGKWAGVSGYVEADSPLRQAWIELGEEVGLGEGELLFEAAGEPLRVEDPSVGKTWLVHPFRFRLLGDSELELDWEHVEMRWILPDEILSLETVPGLFAAWCKVAP